MELANLRSNRSIFIPLDSGSPRDGLFAHISGLGRLARLDFEHFSVAGEVIFRIDGDAAPTSQEDEEARIGTLAYALKRLGDKEDAAEFARCLNVICEGGDARYRQAAASHYFREIASRGAGAALKEMALLAMQLGALDGAGEAAAKDELTAADNFAEESGPTASHPEDAGRPESRVSLFEQELRSVTRLVTSRRGAAKHVHDDFAAAVDDLEAGGAGVEELDAAFAHLAAMEQYDEGGAIVAMSSHERTTACGRLDPEFVEEDLPERAAHLAPDLRRAYANGVEAELIREEIDAQLEVIFPVSGRTQSGGRFYSHANRGLQSLTREILAAVLADCQADFHLTALRTCRGYRAFHKAVRAATDTRQVGEVMRKAYESRRSGALPLKHFTALNTAARLQRGRLESAPLSKSAASLLKEISAAGDGKLRYLRWAMYGDNMPGHPVHRLTAQEQSRIWQALRARQSLPARAAAA